MLPIHLKRLRLLRDLDKVAGIYASHNDGYNRDAARPYKSYTTTPLDTDSFQNRAANSFLVSFFSFKFQRAINGCYSACEYLPLFICFAESEQPNIGQSYCLCLQIEWQPSRRRMFVGGLGSREKNFVDNGQARTITALENI